MRGVCILAAPGFFRRTGYFYRVMRDREMLRAAGQDVAILVMTRKGWRDEHGRPVPFANAIGRILGTDSILYENIAPALASLLRPRACRRDAIVVHGSLAELDADRHAWIRKPVYGYLLRRALRRFARTFCVSDALADYLVEEHGGNRDRIVITPNLPDAAFVDHMRTLWETTTCADMRKALKLPVARKYICYSGNAQAWQKADMLIKAFARIQARSDVIDLILLTRDKAAFQALLSAHAIAPERVIVRTVENSAVPEYLFASDLLYMVRDQNEVNRVACPTKAMEYLISGRPIVTSRRLGDVSGQIEQGNSGLVLDQDVCNDPAHLAGEIIRFLESNSTQGAPPDFDRQGNSEYLPFYGWTDAG